MQVLVRFLPQDIENGTLSRRRLPIDKVHNLALGIAGDPRMWRLNKALECGRMPMIAPGHSRLAVHPLLDDHPLAFGGDYEAVQIELETVANSIVIDSGGKPAGPYQLIGVQPDSFSNQ